MKENLYKNIRDKKANILNKLYLIKTLDDKQLKKEMEKLKLEFKEIDIDKIYAEYKGEDIKKSYMEQLEDLFISLDEKIELAIEEDKDGTGFIKGMFLYELRNLGCIYNGDLLKILEDLDLTMEDIEKNDKLKNGLKLAKKEYLETYGEPEKKKHKEREER